MNKRLNFILIGFILSSILFLGTHLLREDQYSPGSDEGYYYHYARIISEKGTRGFSDLIDWYSGNEEARFHPAPVRGGYILLSASLFKITGPSYSILGKISFTCFLLFLFVSFYFTKKHFNDRTALLLTLLLSTSPLMLAMSRRALIDSPVNLVWALAIWTFFDFLTTQKRRASILFILSFSLALVIKEASVILFPFFLITAFIYKYYYHNRVNFFSILTMTVGSALIAGIFYLLILGGWGGCITAFKAIATTHFETSSLNSYAVLYSAGPWYRYIIDYILLTPITTLLFIGYFLHLLMVKKWGWKTTYFLLYFAIVYGILSSFPHTKVVRFAINLEMVISLFSILALNKIFSHKEEKVRDRRVVFTVLVIAFLNFASFLTLFYHTGLLDPISYHLLRFRHFIP